MPRSLNSGIIHSLFPAHIQSLTLPLQGFMNAIVYGWTRKDFVEAMAILPEDLRTKETDPFVVDQEVTASDTGCHGTGKKMLNSSLLLSQGLSNSADLIRSTEIEVLTDACDSEYEVVV